MFQKNMPKVDHQQHIKDCILDIVKVRGNHQFMLGSFSAGTSIENSFIDDDFLVLDFSCNADKYDVLRGGSCLF